jgi:hypothetical protein
VIKLHQRMATTRLASAVSIAGGVLTSCISSADSCADKELSAIRHEIWS